MKRLLTNLAPVALATMLLAGCAATSTTWETDNRIVEKDGHWEVQGEGYSQDMQFSRDKAAFHARAKLASFLAGGENSSYTLRYSRMIWSRTKKEGNLYITQVLLRAPVDKNPKR